MSMIRKNDNKRFIIDKKTNCWNYTMAKDKDGYGLLTVNSKQYQAHRYFYEKYRDKIPKGMVIDHLCKNTSCVNPYHLEIVTPYENYIGGKNAKLSLNNVNKIRELYKI